MGGLPEKVWMVRRRGADEDVEWTPEFDAEQVEQYRRSGHFDVVEFGASDGAAEVALNEPMRDALSALLDDSMAMDEAGGQCVLEIDATGCLTANGYLLDREGEWVSPTVPTQPTKETYTREQLESTPALHALYEHFGIAAPEVPNPSPVVADRLRAGVAAALEAIDKGKGGEDV